MPFDIENKLVIAIASSALFDLSESDKVFREQGEDAYRKYQRQHENHVLSPGVAFAFVKKILSFNEGPDDSPVEVILLSRNDPETGLRVMNSIETHKLNMTRAAFLNGREPHRYIKAYNASLFLSANESDVRSAIMAGYPAGFVLDGFLNREPDDVELRIAFDFDGVIVDDTAEGIYQRDGLEGFQRSEAEQANTPLNAGPLKELLTKVAELQKLDRSRAHGSKDYSSRLRIAIVTSRNAPAHKRVVTTLRKWGITVDETFFLGGMDKARIIREFKPHVFFDDQRLHLDAVHEVAPCVHVPYGLRNLSQVQEEKGQEPTIE